MSLHQAALILAGVIGSGVAVAHGVVVQRLMVRPLGELAQGRREISGSVKRLVPLLLHFSTVCWLFGGLALIAAASWFGEQVTLVTGLFVGSFYLLAAVGNFWATRGRHPGWMLMTLALALMTFGLGAGS